MTGWLAPALTTIALCWRLDRRDGVSLGFTTHDRDLTLDGLIYRAAPGMTPSAVTLGDGFDVDTHDVKGALTHDALSDEDLLAGRWDGASVRLFALDWSDPAAGSLHLARGDLGEVSISDAGFTAELAGPTAALERPVIETTSPDCRAELGDKRCRVDMAKRMRIAHVVAADGTALTLDTTEPTPNAYGQGMLRWIDGPNSGLQGRIAASSGSAITLRDAPPFAAAAGTPVMLIEGCDRTIGTCRTRFSNAANFRGEPYLPGNDLLTRYPGA